MLNYCQGWEGWGKGKGDWRERDGNRGKPGKKESIQNALGSLRFSDFSVCVSLNRCQQHGNGDGRWERYCDSGRECAIEKKHLSEGWDGCYDNYLYSRLSVMFHWSLERGRRMNVGEELGKEGL